MNTIEKSNGVRAARPQVDRERLLQLVRDGSVVVVVYRRHNLRCAARGRIAWVEPEHLAVERPGGVTIVRLDVVEDVHEPAPPRDDAAGER